MEKVRRPYFRLLFLGKDITRDISGYCLSVSFTDHEHGKSDEVEVRLEDSQGLFRGPWMPQKGSVMQLSLGYENQALLPCGSFEMDQVELSGPPDELVWRGLAAPITLALRQRGSVAYENMTLRAIAQQVAARHGLSVFGDIREVTFGRITQNNEGDLAFLKRLAEDYGHAMKLVEKKLVFTLLDMLETAAASLVVDRSAISRYTFRDASHETAQAAQVDYHEPGRNEKLSFSASASGVVKGDTLKVKGRVENRQQAQLKAQAALRRANQSRLEATLTMAGEVNLSAGINLTLTGFGAFSGDYHVEMAKHTVDRQSGYTTEVSLRGVQR